MNTKARNLAVYTLQILANQKYFPQDQEAFIDRIRDTVLEISALCWEANNIKVDGDPARFTRRNQKQEQAVDLCNRMCHLIEIAKPLFHLDTRRVQYWLGLVNDLKGLIRRWQDENTQRLKP